MRAPKARRSAKFMLSRMVWIIVVFSTTATISSLAQTLTTLVSFDGTNGANPSAAVVQGTDGNFYGTTIGGGVTNPPCYADGCGTVFKITPTGSLTTLYSFCTLPNCADGAMPWAGLVQATDGNFYGTTRYTGANGGGTIFKITPGGTLTTLYSFCTLTGCNGYSPSAALVQATDGNFYGTTTSGGTNGWGTIFKITPNGTLTTLHTFCARGYPCVDGGETYAGLVQATDGNLDGVTTLGGANTWGMIFKITLGGTFTTLYSFCLQPVCTDGSQPFAALVEATDGNFYGTTSSGGANSYGTVFKVTPGGTLTTLHSFNVSEGYSVAALVEATDGNFYGTTANGGTSNNCVDGCGTIFRITPTGTLSTLHSFDGSDGELPVGALAQAIDGNFYGTAKFGGAGSDGTVFSISVGLNNTPWQFVPVTPCRAVDTRPPSGGGPIQAGTFQYFAISGAGSCATLPSAAAYSMNVSVVPNGSLGYLTVWPAGRSRPLVSTLNSLDGRIKANAAIIPAGANGEISVYATDTTNVIVDINGYFAPVSGSTLAFYPLTPCRVADTRHNTYPQGLGPPFLTGGHERAFPILNATICNIPSSATAYSLNFSVVPHGALYYMTVWPTGETRPTVSTLNDIPGQIIANAAIVVAGTSGDVSVYPTNDTDLIIDINGYFAAPGQGGLSLYPAVPCRVIDTRKMGGGQPFSGTLSPPVDVVGSPCGVPSAAQAYVFNASVVPQGPLGYLTLWPDGASQPLVSTLNALDGSISSNMAIVPSTDGKVGAYASGLTQLILDISSYFAP